MLLYIVNKDAKCGIWTDYECIKMSELISFAKNFLLDQVVFSIAVKDSMHFLGGVTTDIWSKHDTETNNKNAKQKYQANNNQVNEQTV